MNLNAGINTIMETKFIIDTISRYANKCVRVILLNDKQQV